MAGSGSPAYAGGDARWLTAARGWWLRWSMRGVGAASGLAVGWAGVVWAEGDRRRGMMVVTACDGCGGFGDRLVVGVGLVRSRWSGSEVKEMSGGEDRGEKGTVEINSTAQNILVYIYS
ncbi:hypothetical protein Droror1_Dr00009134 [Drosera rotundifolia]